MSLSDTSSSSSDEEEFSVLSLIRGEPAPKVRPKTTARATPEPIPVKRSVSPSKEDTEFDIPLPSIFQYDAQRNEQIRQTELELRHDFIRQEHQLRDQYDGLMAKKRKILDELNQNGSQGTRVYTLDNDGELVENLTKESIKMGGLHNMKRHFYFFSTVHSVSLPSDSLPFTIDHFLCSQLSSKAKRDRLRTRIRPHLPQFINHVLSNITNPHQLTQLNLVFEEWVLRGDEFPVNTNDLLVQLSAVGGNADVITPRKDTKGIAVKLGHFNSNPKLSLIRTALILNHHLLYKPSGKSYEQILEVFLLTLCDFNCNQYEISQLYWFVTSVFPNIVHVFSPSITTNSFKRDDFYFTFYSTFKYCVKPYVYGNQCDTLAKRHERELLYNILKLLIMCFGHSPDTLHTIVSKLSMMFLLDTEEPIATDDLELTPPVIKKVFNSIRSIDILEGFRKKESKSISAFYNNYYRIELLKYMLPRPFEKNNFDQVVHADPARYERIRRHNAKRLTDLIGLVNGLRTDLHSTIRGFVYIHTEDEYSREQMVNDITTSYQTLNYIHNKYEKDLALIKSDLFYN